MNVINMAKEIAHTKAYGMYPNFTDKFLQFMQSSSKTYLTPVCARSLFDFHHHHHHHLDKDHHHMHHHSEILHMTGPEKYCIITSLSNLVSADICTRKGQISGTFQALYGSGHLTRF